MWEAAPGLELSESCNEGWQVTSPRRFADVEQEGDIFPEHTPPPCRHAGRVIEWSEASCIYALGNDVDRLRINAIEALDVTSAVLADG
jgi:hypothetical protein